MQPLKQCTTLYQKILYSTIIYSSILYCTKVNYITLCYIILYYKKIRFETDMMCVRGTLTYHPRFISPLAGLIRSALLNGLLKAVGKSLSPKTRFGV